MNALNSIELKVGLLICTVLGLVVFMSMRISEDPNYLGRSRTFWFLMNNASGLIENSSVKMAGISVGTIEEIRLERGKARVEMLISSKIPITQSARIEIRANGILGDKRVEIIVGSPNDIPIEDGGQILIVNDHASMSALMSEVSKISQSLSEVADTIRFSIQGDGNTQDSLGRIVRNLENLTADVSEMTAESKGDVRVIVGQVRSITETLGEFINDNSDSGFKASWDRVANSFSSIDRTLKNTEEITEKINSGEGTLGRLINDEETVDELNQAIEGVNSLLGSAYKLKTSFDVQSAYYELLEKYKSSVHVKIQPGLDRYYIVGITDDPRGLKEITETKTVTVPGAEENKIETVSFKDEFALTLIFAKNIHDFTVKGGIKESHSSLGVDYHFFKRQAYVSAEVLEFSNLNLRLSAKLKLYNGFYLYAGMDGLLDKLDDEKKGLDYRRSNYFGMGLVLNNDDLKLLSRGMSF